MAKHPRKMRVMGCLLAKAARFLQAKGPVTRCVLRLRMAARGGENRKGMSKTDIIVQDYFCLLKKVCRQKSPPGSGFPVKICCRSWRMTFLTIFRR